MADALVDFATLDSAASAVETAQVETTVDSTVVDTPEVDSTLETPEVDDSTTEGTETETTNADGSEKSAEEQAAIKKAATDKAASSKALGTSIGDQRTALKALRDLDPKYAGVVKELHGSAERWNAAKEIFPKGVNEMREAKEFIDLVGGAEGYQKMQQQADMITATDELLYNGDPAIWDNVIDDIKAAGHPEALGALAPSFLSKLKEHDKQGYYDTFVPHFVEGLKEVNFQNFLGQFQQALDVKGADGTAAPDMAAITSAVARLTAWYKDMEKSAADKTKAPEDTPERKKFLAEKEAFQKEKTTAAEAEKAKFESGVAEECEKNNNTVLGRTLGSNFLKLPFFKDFPRETLVDLGNGIKDRLYNTLKADKVYQAQMNAMWKQKSPDRAKIVQYHNAKLEAIAPEVVRSVVQNRYPGYAKGGTAAGRVAAAEVKKVATTKAATQSVDTGKPIYVAARPTNLVREDVTVNGKTYTSSDLITMQITGKGFVKTTDGKSYKFVTWRK